MSRIIFHLEVPDFAVAVERVRYQTLATRPVIIAPAGSSRAQVLGVSNEARDGGVVVGMRLKVALRLCPRAVVLPPDHLLYRRAATAAGRILDTFTPVIERNTGGRFFLDMTGTSRLFGPARDAAAKILRDLSERILLTASLGIAVNKSVSRVASSVVRHDLLDVIPGGEMSFLSPWEVRRLPGSEQVKDPRLFEDLCIRQIGDLAGYTAGHLSLAFGRLGPMLHQRARGVDPRPVLPPDKKPTVNEQAVLTEDTNSRDRLLARLLTLTERCGYRLRTLGAIPRTAVLSVGYSDNMTLEGRTRLSPPTFDDGSLFAAVRPLFARVATRRVRARYLGLTFTDLTAVAPQLRLFGDRGRDLREKSLTCALDRIRNHFGIDAIARGAA